MELEKLSQSSMLGASIGNFGSTTSPFKTGNLNNSLNQSIDEPTTQREPYNESPVRAEVRFEQKLDQQSQKLIKMMHSDNKFYDSEEKSKDQVLVKDMNKFEKYKVPQGGDYNAHEDEKLKKFVSDKMRANNHSRLYRSSFTTDDEKGIATLNQSSLVLPDKN